MEPTQDKITKESEVLLKEIYARYPEVKGKSSDMTKFTTAAVAILCREIAELKLKQPDPKKETELSYMIGHDIGELQKRVSKLELLSESKEHPGGSFGEWKESADCKSLMISWNAGIIVIEDVLYTAFNAGQKTVKTP